MSDDSKSCFPSLEIGIESVHRLHQPLPSLPDVSEAGPSAHEEHSSQFERLMSYDGLYEVLQKHLKPKVRHPDILHPSAFRDELESIMQKLKQLAKEHPKCARGLRQTVEVLSEECSLRDLAHMYRSSLHQG